MKQLARRVYFTTITKRENQMTAQVSDRGGDGRKAIEKSGQEGGGGI